MIIILSILGGLLNRWRGGWEIRYLDKIPHQVRRLIVCLIPTIALLLPFRDCVSWWVWPISYFLFLIIGLIPGWGSWFFIGRAPDSWKHNSDAFWAEFISYLVYGPKWIPFKNDLTIEELSKLRDRYDVEYSPTRKIRPIEWRIKMERFAMNVRGLGFTVPQALLLYFYFFYAHDVLLWSVIFIAPLGYLMGYLYEVGFFLNMKKFPSWLNMTTNLGEFLTGFIILGGGMYALSTLARSFL